MFAHVVSEFSISPPMFYGFTCHILYLLMFRQWEKAKEKASYCFQIKPPSGSDRGGGGGGGTHT